MDELFNKPWMKNCNPNLIYRLWCKKKDGSTFKDQFGIRHRLLRNKDGSEIEIFLMENIFSSDNTGSTEGFVFKPEKLNYRFIQGR